MIHSALMGLWLLAVPGGADSLSNVPVATASLADVLVLRAYNRRATGDTAADSAAGIGDLIRVEVTGLRALDQYVRCQNEQGETIDGCVARTVSLFLDGREMVGISPLSRSANDSGALEFRLERTAESDAQWSDLLGSPHLGSAFWNQPAVLSVGPSGGFPVATQVTGFELIRFRPVWFGGSLVVVAVIVILAFYKGGAVSDMLRDGGKTQIGKNGRVLPRPYSLARCQMAAWFAVVIGSFFFIWLVTKDLSTITSTALVLIGMGAGTGIWAVAADGGKRRTRNNALEEAIAEKTALEQEIAGLNNQLAVVADKDLTEKRNAKQGVVQVLTARIADLTRRESMQPTSGVLADLLTDDYGNYALYRVQMLLWTVALIVIFVNQVWTRLSMPEFSTTLLALMGISSGTYLGFKLQEAAP